MPRVTAREAERAILRDGWTLSSSRGSHRHYTQPTKGGRVTIAHHSSAIIRPKTLGSILIQAVLSVDQFTNLL